MRSAAVVARGLTKRFGRGSALADVDFELPRGQTLAVLGAHGAGKSTLLRLAAGLARATSGSIALLGEPATTPASRGRVGYVGHATHLYPALTARENLVFSGRLHGLSDLDTRVAERLEHEGLTPVADRPAGGFSRGMAQRLAIARGLLHDPAIVLLDEPFTGLDRAAAERLLARLAALRDDEGRTLLWITHDPEAASRVSDQGLVLERGRVAYQGPPTHEALEQALRGAAPA